MPIKLPQSIVPTRSNDTKVFKVQLLNIDLTNKQKSTLIHLIDIHPKIFPNIFRKCLSIYLPVDTPKPFASYKLHNAHGQALSIYYETVSIAVPLDTPIKSTITLVGVKQPSYRSDMAIQDVDDVHTTFNATKIESWYTILDKLRPMLMHYTDTHKRYGQSYDEFLR